MTLDCVKNVSSLRERNSSQGSFLFCLKNPRSQSFEGCFYVRSRFTASGPFRRIRVLCSSAVTAPSSAPANCFQLAVHTVVVKIEMLGHVLGSSLHQLLHVRISFPSFQAQPLPGGIFTVAAAPPYYLWLSLDVLVVEIKMAGHVLDRCLHQLILHREKLLSLHLADAALCLGIFI
jgi:sorbitol-specific phosphotransferase system component IIA